MGPRWLATALAALTAGCGEPGGGGAAGPAPGVDVRARVLRVVDGDTIVVSLAGRRERVRYIGVDAPEPGRCFAAEASALNARLVGGRRVGLRLGARPRDRHGRLLADVRREPDGLAVAPALVAGGYATALAVPPNVSQAARIAGLERRARRDRAGLWGKCTIPD